MVWFSFPLVAVRTFITLGGAVRKSILRIPHRKFDELFGRQVFRFHGAEVEQMAAGSDDELDQADWFIGWIFVNGNYGAFGHAACYGDAMGWKSSRHRASSKTFPLTGTNLSLPRLRGTVRV